MQNSGVETRRSQESDTEPIPKTDPRSAIISIDPERKGGVPCFKGTRVPVQDLWNFLTAGGSLDEFLDSFPTVTREQAISVIQMAGEKLLEGLPIQQNSFCFASF